MKILVTGAYGFIGSAVTARLSADGHEIIGVGRRIAEARTRRPDIRWIALDIGRAKSPEDWLPHLQGMEAVVNCAGVLQDAPGDDVKGVHLDGTLALFDACKRANVRRVIHVSAIGADATGETDFARTKAQADEALMKSGLDWVVLRPSIVVGRNVYGGTALIRALAALPVLPIGSRDAVFQPVQVSDVAEAVAFFINPDRAAKRLLEVAGPERMTLTELAGTYRRWLGFKPARLLRIPDALQAALFRIGDWISLLGWRPPVRTTALRQLSRDVTGDAKEWAAITGITPSRLQDALARDPASVQERWFAHLFLLKPALLGGLAFFWIISGLIALGPARESAVLWLTKVGLTGSAALAMTVATSLLNIALGIGIAIRKTARLALWGTIAVAAGYLALGLLLLPQLWADPLGPLAKIIPALLASFAALAILDDR